MSRGVIDALLMIVIVAGLAGMYLLRRDARAVLLYRRRWSCGDGTLTANSSAACVWSAVET